jgi:Ser/Thr protein kinase RdoA (MazF antagonist)
MNTDEQFFHLTPDSIIKALEESGFSPTGQFLQLNSLENRVYSLMLDDGSHVVTKFYRPGRWTSDQIREEHEFIKDLDDAEVPVCSPLVLANGSTFMQSSGIYFAVWKRTGGRIPDEFSDSMLMMIGRLIARLHNVGGVRASKFRVKMNSENFIMRPFQFLVEKGFLSANIIPRFEKCVKDATHALNCALEGVPLFRIHGDCHWGNLLHNGDRFFFLDFDDFVTGPAVQDIWMIAPAVDARGIVQREVLLEGYRQFRPFEARWLNAVNPLRAARYINYAAWIARRIDDPSFKTVFPNFGTEEYWERETSDLEMIIRDGFEPEYIRDVEHQTKEDYSELTNKDYFYDME